MKKGSNFFGIRHTFVTSSKSIKIEQLFIILISLKLC